MSKHTPGPWHREMRVYPRPEPVVIPLKAIYCEQLGMQVAFVNGGVEREAQAKANARLIASAPDLLDALNEMLAVFAKPHNETLREVVDARAAIAKATDV